MRRQRATLCINMKRCGDINIAFGDIILIASDDGKEAPYGVTQYKEMSALMVKLLVAK